MPINKLRINKIVYIALWGLIVVPELYLVFHDFSNSENIFGKVIAHLFYLAVIYYVLIKKLGYSLNTLEWFKNEKVQNIYILPEPEVNPPKIPYNNLGINFGENTFLVSYNPHKLVNANSIEEFIGLKVQSVDKTKMYISFNFDNNKQIHFSLDPKDYEGPEAMQLVYKGQIIIIN